MIDLLNTVRVDNISYVLSPIAACQVGDVPAGMDRELFEWALRCFLLQHMRFEIDVEMFATDDDRSLAFCDRASREPLAFFDNFLEDSPVYILKRGERFRLRIDLAYDPQLHIPIDKIASIVAKAPDAEAFSLDVVQSIGDGALNAVAFFDPTQTSSQRLNSVSPYFGLTDRKYVRVELCIKVQLRSGLLRELNLYDCLFCKVVYPKSRLRLHKFLGMFVTKEERQRKKRGRFQ